jgi:hypothetical protein
MSVHVVRFRICGQWVQKGFAGLPTYLVQGEATYEFTSHRSCASALPCATFYP